MTRSSSFADRSRALPVVDPDDRELLMSCGAALFTCATAIRHYGFEDEVELLPRDDDPDLLARIGLGEARSPTRAENLRSGDLGPPHEPQRLRSAPRSR